MSDSTQHLDVISSSQSQKEVTANAMLDAASPAALYGRRASTTSGLTWGYYGGKFLTTAGTITAISNGTIALTASATNYIEVDPATGTVSKNTTAFTAGYVQLYQVVTGASTISSYTDKRTIALIGMAAWLAGLTMKDGTNIVLGTTTGTKIGTATSQKLGLWNATPIVQPVGSDQAAVTVVNTNGAIGGLTISAAYSQGEVQALRDACETLADDVRNLSTLIHAMRTGLVNLGAIKGAA